VKGIARGARLTAIRESGLLLQTPGGDRHARFAVFETPGEAGIGADDVVLLTMKGQETPAALQALREAGLRDQPVFCFQNGVDNERAALRLFPNVYGVMVIQPSVFLTPGRVAAFGTPKPAIFDIGRFPAGTDAKVDTMVATLERARFAAFAHPDVMHSKYAKLLSNLSNAVGAALGDAFDHKAVTAAATEEARRVLDAAGIGYGDVGPGDPRRAQYCRLGDIPGVPYAGSSSSQSLLRGTGSVETDLLNGEIVLLGRLHGVPTPVNAWLCDLTQILVSSGRPAGSITPADTTPPEGLGAP